MITQKETQTYMYKFIELRSQKKKLLNYIA